MAKTKLRDYSKDSAYQRFVKHLRAPNKQDEESLIHLLDGIAQNIEAVGVNEVHTVMLVSRFQDLLQCTVDIYNILDKYTCLSPYDINLKRISDKLRDLRLPRLVNIMLRTSINEAKRSLKSVSRS